MSLPEQLREWQEIDKRHRAEGQKSNIDRLETIAEALVAEVERLEKIEKAAWEVIKSQGRRNETLDTCRVDLSKVDALEGTLAAEPPAVHIGRTPQSVLDAARALGGMPPADEPCEECVGTGEVLGESVTDSYGDVYWKTKPCSKCTPCDVCGDEEEEPRGKFEIYYRGVPVCDVCGHWEYPCGKGIVPDMSKEGYYYMPCPKCGEKGKSDD